MPDELPRSLNCPACGAPLELDGKSAMVRCKFCRNVSLVPGIGPQAGMPGVSLDEVRRLAESGNTLEAIRMYREMFQTGLKEAREAVEALQAGRLVEPGAMTIHIRPQREFTEVLKEISDLVAKGDKINAIKMYRENRDVSLTQAKYAIDQIEAGSFFQPDLEVLQPALKQASQAAKTAGRLGCIIAASVILFVGGILAFVMIQAGGPFTPLLIPNGPAMLVPMGADAAPDVAVLFYNVTDETRQIGMLNGTNGKRRWVSEALPGEGYGDGMGQNADLVFAANDAALVAYRKSDGSLAWQTTMSDRLNYGEDTLVVAGGQVITSNLDQTIQAFEAASGVLIWSKRLGGYDRRLRLADGLLVIFDYTADDYTYSLIFIDPASGREERVLTPTCPYNEYSTSTIDPDAGLFFDERESSLYLVYDSSPGCIQRIDPGSGGVAWQTLSEDWFSFASDGVQGLLTGESLLFSNETDLLRVDRAGGALKTLISNEDYEFSPLAVVSERLIVRARRTRGTEAFELWGVALPSGELVWQMSLEGADPLDPPNEISGLVDSEDSAWTWHLNGEELVLVEFQAEPTRMVLKTIRADDGTLAGEMTIALKKSDSDFYSIPEVIGWRRQVIHFSLDGNIYAVDTGSGEVLFTSR